MFLGGCSTKRQSICRGEPPKLPLTAYLTPAGWRERWQRILGGAKSVYTLAKCRRHLKPFGLIDFKKEALRLYLDINLMIAQGDRTGLRHVLHHLLVNPKC